MHSVELQAEQMCYAEEYIFALYFFLPVQKTFYSSVQFSVIVSSLAMLSTCHVSKCVSFTVERSHNLCDHRPFFFWLTHCHYFFKYFPLPCYITLFMTDVPVSQAAKICPGCSWNLPYAALKPCLWNAYFWISAIADLLWLVGFTLLRLTCLLA